MCFDPATRKTNVFRLAKWQGQRFDDGSQSKFNCLKAGEIYIHSDLLLYGFKANESDRRHCGLTLRYAPVEVRVTQGWNAKGVLLKGVDPDQYRGNPKRPLKTSF